MRKKSLSALAALPLLGSEGQVNALDDQLAKALGS
jgi:hypothetical protein